MKTLLIISTFFLFTCYEVGLKCRKLKNGKYSVHFILGGSPDYIIKIKDGFFVKYFSNHDSSLGKIKWIYDCDFVMDNDPKQKADTVSGPLKLIYDSWGEPCVELNTVRGDTLEFRTTHSGNPHITINRGYFLRLSE